MKVKNCKSEECLAYWSHNRPTSNKDPSISAFVAFMDLYNNGPVIELGKIRQKDKVTWEWTVYDCTDPFFPDLVREGGYIHGGTKEEAMKEVEARWVIPGS
jgi:hypothetical protein